MTKTETKNETSIPMTSTPASMVVNENPNFTSFSRLAPNMTGMARKNVNSAATLLETPMSSAPTIVAPERDVPGKTAAISWNTPMRNAVWKVMSFSFLIFGFPYSVVPQR